MEHWLIAEIRALQERMAPQAGSAENPQPEELFDALSNRAQEEWQRLELNKALLTLSSADEIAEFIKLSGLELPVTADQVPRKPGAVSIIVSDLLRSERHRSYSKEEPALCGKEPVGGRLWMNVHDQPSPLLSRNCRACERIDSDQKQEAS